MTDHACSVEGCAKSAHARELCPMHYQRLRKYGTTEAIFPQRKAKVRRVGVEPCEIDGCEKPMQARGWCSAHWSRWKRHGSPTAQVRGEIVDGKRICPHCRTAVAVGDWYVSPKGRFILCRECFGEWNRDRGHARRATATGPRFTRREVLERDGWMCQLCAADIDRGLSHPHPMSATLDHIIPVSRGGEHSLENAQAAHRICNMRKWAHVTEAAS